MRKQVPPEKTKDVLEFATKRPRDRLDSIRNGLAVRRSFFRASFLFTLLLAGTGLRPIRICPSFRYDGGPCVGPSESTGQSSQSPDT